MDDKILERVKALEARGTPIAWIPEDGSSFVEGHGYRVAIVLAGDDGYHLTGTWPYTGAVDEKMPWFWGGPTKSNVALRLAKAATAAHNMECGVTEKEAFLIVARSMTRGQRARKK